MVKISLCVAMIAATVVIARADCAVQLSGRWMCKTSQGLVPLKNVHIELYDSDCDGSHVCDDRLDQRDPSTGEDRTVSYSTDANGYFTISGYGGDWGTDIGSWTRPEPYVAAFLQNEGTPRASAQDEIEHIRSKTSGEKRFDDACGDLGNIPDLVYDEDAADGTFTRCEDFLALQRVAQDYYDTMGGQEPPYGEARLLIWSMPYGTVYTEYDKIRYAVGQDPNESMMADARTNGAVAHEFAHTIYFTQGGRTRNDFNIDVGTYRYASQHYLCDSRFPAGYEDFRRRGFTFSEGWAEYWEGIWIGCGVCPGGSPCVRFPAPFPGATCSSYPCNGSELVPLECCSDTWTDTTNVEGNVARAIRLLETQCHLTRRQLVEILASNNSIHSWNDFYAAAQAQFDTCSVDLSSDVGSQSSKLTGLSPFIDREAENALAIAENSALQQTATLLKAQRRDAIAAARLACDFGTADCAAIQIEPWALRIAQRQTKLELKRRKFHPSSLPFDADEMSRIAKARTDFDTKLGRAMIRAFSHAEAAVAKLPGDYSPVVHKLQDRRLAVSNALQNGARLPDYAYRIGTLQKVFWCGNDTCDANENATTCPRDCPPNCGNGTCEAGENANNCDTDCDPQCGNAACESGENANNCSGDCTPACGNSACEAGENAINCSSDCSAVCGNSVCEPGETCQTIPSNTCMSCCCGDCGCGTGCGGYACSGSGACGIP